MVVVAVVAEAAALMVAYYYTTIHTALTNTKLQHFNNIKDHAPPPSP
jgi:hypothetical protein